MMTENDNYVCEVCGKEDLVLSHIHIVAGYGSKYDGADVEIELCGSCLDSVVELLCERAEV